MKLEGRSRLLGAALLAVVMLSSAPAIRADANPLEGLDAYVEMALREWEIPGAAISIVSDDQVILAKGYGVRELGKPDRVDERTLFAIGSATKAFTAAALAILVDEKKLHWDDPATKYLPSLQFFDPYVTREMTARDLLCHRSGLDRADLLWYGSRFDRDEILRRVRFVRPSWSFRSRFGYQNLMVLAAGQIVAAVTGRSWDDFVRERIFAPLGMTSSNTSVTALSGNIASPHSKIDGKVRVVPWRNIDNVAPAGSINSNVVDMAQWVRLQLGQGMFEGRTIFSRGSAAEMHSPQTIVHPEPLWKLWWPEARFITYGLGWFLDDYRGRKVVEHGGAIDGMRALVAMIPEEKIGLVILSNLDGTSFPEALKYRIFDAVLGAPKRDWSAETLGKVRELDRKAEEEEKKIEKQRVRGTRPSLPLDGYAGAYTSETYGDVKVAPEGGKLVVRLGPVAGDAEHWHFDTFLVRWRDPMLGKSRVTFVVNADGRASELRASFPDSPEILFVRAPEAPSGP